MMISRRLMMAGGMASIATAGRAQPQFDPITLRLFDAAQPAHQLDDRLVELSDGSRYRLFRAIPKSAPPPEGWPVLWLTDGNAYFDRMPADLLAAYPGLMIVGVGYDTDLPFLGVARARDYTPPPLRPDPKRPERMVGGADTFLNRIEGPLRDLAEGGLTTDPKRRTLAGHSYGGLFAIYTRGRDSGFTRFCAASPSFWLEPDLPPQGSQLLTIFVGDQERERHRAVDPDSPAFQIPVQTQEYVDAARAAGQNIDLKILPGMQHGATLAGALPDIFAIAGK